MKEKVLKERENTLIKVVGVCDSSGALHSKEGLDLMKLIAHKNVKLLFLIVIEWQKI